MFASCKDHNNEVDKSNFTTISFSTIDSNQVKLSSRIKTIAIIPLETKPQSLISQVDKLRAYDNYLMILDKRGAKGVMIFDKQGKFIRKIGKLGKKTGQYIMIDDFSFNKEKSLIYTLVNENRVNVYNLSGKFVETFKLNGFFASGIEYLSNSNKLYFTCEDLNQGNLVITDLAGKIEKGFFPNTERGKKGEHIRIQVHAFVNYDTTLIYKRYLDDNIYSINDDKVKIKYKIDFGAQALTQAKLSELMNLSEDSLKTAVIPYKRDVKYYIENEKAIEILFFYNKSPYIGIYNKVSYKANVYPYKNLIDDIFYQKQIPLSEYIIDGNFAAIMQPTTLPKSDRVKEELKRFSINQENIKIDNNPFIWIYSNK